jgi:hypothetical protein
MDSTQVSPVVIGQVVKVVDKSQFQHVCVIGAVQSLEWWRGGLYARVFRWPWLVPVDQLVPLRRDAQ